MNQLKLNSIMIKGIFFWPIALAMHIASILVVYFVFSEITNPFLNVRWLLENRSETKGGTLYFYIALLLILLTYA